ncbi:Proteasome subunit beta type-3 [Phytophthora cinnamomi]|uniref:Proteasome subunit beta type-3 n=1 Tax=Phytophthora cinnamomi TaxID=4785 RepID=UPI00355ABA21|nr:Proteasome subunit beta type-3 [Phytophthora cinnamomi]
MAAAEEHQQRPHAASPTGENAAHVANQVSSKSAQKPLGNGVEKGREQAPSALDTEKNTQKSAKEAGTELAPSAEDAPQTQLRDEGSVGSVRADPATTDTEKETDGKTADSVALEDVPVPMDVDTGGHELQEDAALSAQPVERVEAGGEKQEGVEALQQSTKQPLEGGIDGGAAKESLDDEAAALKETAAAMEVDETLQLLQVRWMELMLTR